MRKKILISLAVLVIILGLAFIYSNKTNNEQDLTPIKVRLGWQHQGQFAGFYMAKEKEFYKEMGLEVELLALDRSKNQVEELGNKSVDFSIMEAHQVLQGISENYPLKAVGVIYKINPHSLAVREDSDIYEPKDFANKVVGLAGGIAEGNALFKIFIEKSGISDLVTYKNLGFNTVDDFMNQRADIIDVYRIDQPYLAEKSGVPLRIIAMDAYGFSTYGDIIATNNELIKTKPEIIEKFVKASMKGWQYAIDHQAEAIDTTLSYTKNQYKDYNYQQHIIQQSAPLIRGSGKLGLMDLVSWSTLYESMRSAGVTNSDLDINNVYTNEFL